MLVLFSDFFARTPTPESMVTVLVYIPICRLLGFMASSHPHQPLLVFVSLMIMILTRMRWDLEVVSIWISLMASDAEYLFKHSVAMFISSMENSLLSSLVHSWTEFSGSLEFDFWRSLESRGELMLPSSWRRSFRALFVVSAELFSLLGRSPLISHSSIGQLLELLSCIFLAWLPVLFKSFTETPWLSLCLEVFSPCVLLAVSNI